MPPWTPQWDGEDLPPLPVFAMAERLKIMPSAQSDVEWHEVFLNEKLDELSSRRKTKIVDALTALWRLQSVKADAGDSPEWGIYVAVWVEHYYDVCADSKFTPEYVVEDFYRTAQFEGKLPKGWVLDKLEESPPPTPTPAKRKKPPTPDPEDEDRLRDDQEASTTSSISTKVGPPKTRQKSVRKKASVPAIVVETPAPERQTRGKGKAPETPSVQQKVLVLDPPPPQDRDLSKLKVKEKQEVSEELFPGISNLVCAGCLGSWRASKCRALWYTIRSTQVVIPIQCYHCKRSHRTCSFARIPWGVSSWPTNIYARESLIGSTPKPRQTPPSVKRSRSGEPSPAPKTQKTPAAIKRSRSGEPKSSPPLSDDSPSPILSHRKSFPLLSDIGGIEQSLKDSSHSKARLAATLAAVKASKEHARRKNEVNSALLADRVKIVDNLCSQYGDILSSMDVDSSSLFVEGSSRDVEAVPASPTVPDDEMKGTEQDADDSSEEGVAKNLEIAKE